MQTYHALCARLGLHGFQHDMPGTARTRLKFVELCAGTCRLSKAVAGVRIPAESFEILRSANEATPAQIVSANVNNVDTSAHPDDRMRCTQQTRSSCAPR